MAAFWTLSSPLAVAAVALVVLVAMVRCDVAMLHKRSRDSALMTQLQRVNFLVGVAAVGVQHANGTQCGQELELFLKAIDEEEFWSLKVIDSFGAAPNSFSWGNYLWFSAQEMCDDLNAPFRITFSDRRHSNRLFNVTSAFPLRFWMVYFRFSTPHYIDLKLPFEHFIHVGLCLPQSCSSAEIFQYAQMYFKSGTFHTQRHFQLQMNAVDIKRPEFKWSFLTHSGSVMFISILLLVLFFGFLAELLHKSKLNLKLQLQLHWKPTAEAAAVESSVVEELLLCFRLSENYERCLHWDDGRRNFLTVIAGMRTVVCLWVTVFHVYYYSLFVMTNTPMIFAKLEYFWLQPVMQACFYVDVFFVISAFLLVYNFLSNEAQMLRIKHNSFAANLKLFLKTLFHRYLRLTPVLIITMLLGDMIFDLLNMYSPFRLDMHSGIYCKDSWWYNLLYVQNFLDMKNICCSWTWYLGCEMQFFILFTALLFVYARNERLAKAMFVLLAAGCVVVSFLCNYYNNITFQIDIVYSTLNQLYVKPWTRIPPYLGGAAFGWLLHRAPNSHHQNDAQPQSPSSSSRTSWRPAFWLCFGALYLLTNFVTYWRSAPSVFVVALMSFGKLLFAAFVGAAIALCAWNRGGVFNAMLSARPFLFLNKFCFSIYMIAPVVVMAVFGMRLQATTFSEVASGVDFIAVILLSIAGAFLTVLLLEMPMQRISSKLLKRF